MEDRQTLEHIKMGVERQLANKTSERIHFKVRVPTDTRECGKDEYNEGKGTFTKKL